MKSLKSLNSQQLEQWINQAKLKIKDGKIPEYIPLLSKVDIEEFAVEIVTTNQHKIGEGNANLTFPLMSVIKPFLLLYLLNNIGGSIVFKKVGKKPSNYSFNSLEQLLLDGGFPRNPMINSGAITLGELLPGNERDTKGENLRLWLNQVSNSELFLNQSILESVESNPNPKNQALVQELVSKGYITNPQLALDTYNYICCLSGTISDLAKLGMILVRNNPEVGAENCQVVRELMKTCGLYEASLGFWQKVGLPTKSGVSGAVIAIVPGQGAIASYSPPLDQQGNSVLGLSLLEQISATLRS